jgi:hypothetical protein
MGRLVWYSDLVEQVVMRPVLEGGRSTGEYRCSPNGRHLMILRNVRDGWEWAVCLGSDRKVEESGVCSRDDRDEHGVRLGSARYRARQALYDATWAAIMEDRGLKVNDNQQEAQSDGEADEREHEGPGRTGVADQSGE